MKPIAIIGSSGHARVVADIVALQQKYKIAGLLDDSRSPGEVAFGYSILGKIEKLPSLIQTLGLVGGLVAVGDNWDRALIVERILALTPDFEFITAIHPRAQCAQCVTIGRGTVVMAGAILNPGSRTDEFCIVNTNASLDHDSFMGPYSSLAPGVTTGGKVKIGAFSAICLGAGIVHGIEIGAHTIVGAGAVVTKDLPAQVVAIGVPARVSRNRNFGDRYL